MQLHFLHSEVHVLSYSMCVCARARMCVRAPILSAHSLWDCALKLCDKGRPLILAHLSIPVFWDVVPGSFVGGNQSSGEVLPPSWRFQQNCVVSQSRRFLATS